MAKKTFISKVTDPNATDGIIEFAQNRTLYADQFTDIDSIKEDIPLETEEGGTIYEDFKFGQIKDFEDAKLIEQSEFLNSKKTKIDVYNSIVHQLKKNKNLRNTLKDDASKENLENALKALLIELENEE